MSGAREEVLTRIRSALHDAEAPPEVPRGYRVAGELPRAAVLALFVERLEETGATVIRATDGTAAVDDALVAHGATRVAVASDLHFRPARGEVVVDHGLSAEALDGLDGALTTCGAACAETGTIAFDGGPGQGRRALTLVPDLHVCLVRAEQVVQTVPELFALLEPAARAGRAIVLVSGPSATSDIEFERVEGVHGPRRLVVVLVASHP